ncbi:MAG: 23S rRNA (guanosine(2251)-2'-O)-methyltransferase RlmB [Oscillospiraceae bacterium]|nr:23S rRNA (guanosine(2251)-2'-O)-methyltransferase RlmB [Oscillospiraceae bacterium]
MNKTKSSSYICGRKLVAEALKSGRPINKIYLQNIVQDAASFAAIEFMAKERGIPVVRVDKAWLDKLTEGPHRGVVALASAKEYSDVGDILNCASGRGESPLVVVANEILDPHNLGAVIRNAEAAGAHGVIVPKRNAAGLTDAVAKASAGAIEYIHIARVANISATLRDLKKRGLWIIGADSSGATAYTDCDMSSAVAIVIGGEHEGLGRLVGETCDQTVSIPMRGKTTSLNASAAAAVMLFEALRQRSRKERATL